MYFVVSASHSTSTYVENLESAEERCDRIRKCAGRNDGNMSFTLEEIFEN